MASAKLLLELPHEARLDLVEAGEKLEGNEEDDGLLRTRHAQLLGAKDVEIAEVGFHVGVAELDVHDLLRNLLLEGVGLLAIRLDNLLASSKHFVFYY